MTAKGQCCPLPMLAVLRPPPRRRCCRTGSVACHCYQPQPAPARDHCYHHSHSQFHFLTFPSPPQQVPAGTGECLLCLPRQRGAAAGCQRANRRAAPGGDSRQALSPLLLFSCLGVLAPSGGHAMVAELVMLSLRLSLCTACYWHLASAWYIRVPCDFDLTNV